MRLLVELKCDGSAPWVWARAAYLAQKALAGQGSGRPPSADGVDIMLLAGGDPHATMVTDQAMHTLESLRLGKRLRVRTISGSASDLERLRYALARREPYDALLVGCPADAPQSIRDMLEAAAMPILMAHGPFPEDSPYRPLVLADPTEENLAARLLDHVATLFPGETPAVIGPDGHDALTRHLGREGAHVLVSGPGGGGLLENLGAARADCDLLAVPL